MRCEYVPEYSSWVLVVEEDDFPLGVDDVEEIMQLAWDLGVAQHNEDPDDPRSLVWIRFPGQDDDLCDGLIDLKNAIFFTIERRRHSSM
jgi:hypothetical protein